MKVIQASATYHLRGLVYYHEQHFMSCIVGPCGMVWFHDGIHVTDSSGFEYEGLFLSLPDMCTRDHRPALVAIYFLGKDETANAGHSL